MEYLTEKWGGHPHYRREVRQLGDDEHGAWFWAPAGHTVRRGDHDVFTSDCDLTILIPPDEWWALSWWRGHPKSIST